MFMDFSMSCCIYDTLMDLWNVHIYIYIYGVCVCVCVCVCMCMETFLYRHHPVLKMYYCDITGHTKIIL